MIFETIELLSHELLDVDTLQSRINNQEFHDILTSHSFLIMTNKGLCLVQKDDDGVHVKYNTTVDLSEYVNIDKLNEVLTTNKYVTSDELKNYVKIENSPSFNFESDGTLVVTIGNITNKYLPITDIDA